MHLGRHSYTDCFTKQGREVFLGGVVELAALSWLYFCSGSNSRLFIGVLSASFDQCNLFNFYVSSIDIICSFGKLFNA